MPGLPGTARFDVLIVGAGHAGAHLAMSLRQLGFAGTIALLGDEPDWPYERPPLSKDYLAGAKPFEALLLKEPEYWALHEIAMLRGRRVASVHPTMHEVRTGDGTVFGYGALVWATGGAPRRLSCAGSRLAGGGAAPPPPPPRAAPAPAPTWTRCARSWGQRPRWRWSGAATSVWKLRPCWPGWARRSR